MSLHRIGRAEIELTVGDVGTAESLLDRVSALHGPRIAPTLERVFDDLSGPERVDRIDRLEIELGPVALDAFDDGFVRALDLALRAALEKILGERGPEARALASRELLELFARTGNLPWYADPTAADPVAAALAALTGDDPGAMIALLRELQDDPLALARLARHCDEHAIATLVRSRWPAESAELLAAARTSADLPADVDIAAHAARRGRTLLAAIARADMTTPAQLLRALRIEHDGGSSDEAPVPLRSPPVEHATPSGADVRAPDPPGAPFDLTECAAGSSAVEAGLAPTSARDGAPEGPSSNMSLSTKMMRHVRQDILRDAADPDEGAPPDRPASPAAPGPPPAPRPTERPSPRAELPPPPTPDALHGAPRSPGGPAGAVQAAPRPTEEPSPLESGGPVPRPRAEVRPRPDALQVARRRALAALDELYVEDAGLVLLWPFLDRFFLRVGLLDDERRFVDAEAPMQAIALLELLAAADPDPPEYRLPLAKLLCGLSPEVGFALARPLAPAQIGECEHLLAAVIAHAPILRDMPIASFRAAFLRRPAVLGTRDGAWLLQVERRAHDAVLDRFPWSWAWVKLPWMIDPLRVEW